MNRPRRLPIGVLVGLVLLLSGAPVQAERTVTLGILAYEPAEVAAARWQPLIDYLNGELDGVRVEGAIDTYVGLDARLRNNDLDFLLTNPSHYLHFRSESGLSSALATLVPVRHGEPVRGFGGVAFTRAEREDLRDWRDIPGQRVAAVLEASLGGFQAQAMEMQRRGIPPPQGSNLDFLGMPHDRVVEAVMAGEADIGFVRIGVLERLWDSGELERDAVRLIGEEALPGFPLVISTRIYPEWPLVTLNQTERDIGRQVLVALLRLEEDHPAARAAGIAGFSVPMDYEPVEALVRELRLPPYDTPRALRWVEFWELYRIPLVIVGVALLLLAAMAFGLLLTNRHLRRAQRLRGQLLASLGEGVFGIDLEGRYTFLNPTACRLLGFANEAEALGINSHATSHHTYPDGSPFPQNQCPIQAVMDSGESIEAWDDTFWSLTGCSFPVLVYTTPLVDGRGAIEGAVVSFQDITERKAAEVALERRQAVDETLSRIATEMVVRADLDQAIETALGYLADLLGGQRAYVFLTRDDAELMDNTHEWCAEGTESVKDWLQGLSMEDFSYWTTRLMQDQMLLVPRVDELGEEAELERTSFQEQGIQALIAVPLKASGEVIGFIGLDDCRGDAHWSKADGEVLRHVANLFGNIIERRRVEQSREALNAELQRSNAELEQFAYAISHDMRQPLRMVNSYLQLLERSLGEALNEDQRRFLEHALDGARRMDTMIVGLLEYSRVGRKTEPLAPLATREALDTALDFLRPNLQESGGQVQVEGDWPEWVVSRDELVRLFQNLIGNAIKYVPAGTRPAISVDSTVESDAWEVRIRDNGVGVDPAQKDRLFKVFSRLHTREEYEGNGIGLALCRRIVEHHGGSIGVESEGPGQGSTFWFRLPFADGGAMGNG